MAMNRRSLLRAAAAGAAYTALGAGALSGCMSESAARQVDWNVLRQRLAGALSLPADTDYATAKMAYNPGFDNRQPAAVARCGTAADVQACVSLASQSGTRIAARSGGHSYMRLFDAGWCADCRCGADEFGPGRRGRDSGHRCGRAIDGCVLRAGAGRALPSGWIVPNRRYCRTHPRRRVGVLSGKYGLTCDSLVSAQVVTPDGVLRTASADSEPDLYWALRGGGGGNLGVVTSFTFKTVAAPQLVVFQLKFPAGTLTDVLGGWQSFTQSAPDEFWSTLGTSAGSPPTCRINGCYVGSESALNTLVDKLVAATGVQPSNRYSLSRNYLSAMMYFGGCSNYSADQCHPNWNGGGALGRESFTASSRVLNKPLSDPAKLTALLTGRTGMDILLDSMVGAPSRIGVADTAFPHRGALATAQIYVGATTPAARTAVTEVRNALGDLVGNAAYVNYIDPALSDWSSAYYGSNAPRLRRIAQKYDPHGVFTFDQSITKC